MKRGKSILKSIKFQSRAAFIIGFLLLLVSISSFVFLLKNAAALPTGFDAVSWAMISLVLLMLSLFVAFGGLKAAIVWLGFASGFIVVVLLPERNARIVAFLVYVAIALALAFISRFLENRKLAKLLVEKNKVKSIEQAEEAISAMATIELDETDLARGASLELLNAGQIIVSHRFNTATREYRLFSRNNMLYFERSDISEDGPLSIPNPRSYTGSDIEELLSHEYNFTLTSASIKGVTIFAKNTTVNYSISIDTADAKLEFNSVCVLRVEELKSFFESHCNVHVEIVGEITQLPAVFDDTAPRSLDEIAKTYTDMDFKELRNRKAARLLLRILILFSLLIAAVPVFFFDPDALPRIFFASTGIVMATDILYMIYYPFISLAPNKRGVPDITVASILPSVLPLFFIRVAKELSSAGFVQNWLLFGIASALVVFAFLVFSKKEYRLYSRVIPTTFFLSMIQGICIGGTIAFLIG